MYRLGRRSQKNLIGVNPKLAFLVTEAILITKQDFMVLDGVRTISEQRKLVARGASKTMNSKHLSGNAVDLVAWDNGKPSWNHLLYRNIEIAMKTVADKHGIKITWGGDWKSFVDMPHWQLKKEDRKRYDIRKYS